MEKIIRIKGREITAKSTGNKFIAWKVRENNGEWNRAKFTRAVNNVPKIEGHYDMVVDTINISSSTDDYGKVWWFNQVEEFRTPTIDTKEADESF